MDDRIEQIRKGWVTNYPNPDFKGDSVGLWASVNSAHEDIKFLLEELDKRTPFINTYMYARMSICYEFKRESVYWVGWDCGSLRPRQSIKKRL